MAYLHLIDVVLLTVCKHSFIWLQVNLIVVIVNLSISLSFVLIHTTPCASLSVHVIDLRSLVALTVVQLSRQANRIGESNVQVATLG